MGVTIRTHLCRIMVLTLSAGWVFGCATAPPGGSTEAVGIESVPLEATSDGSRSVQPAVDGPSPATVVRASFEQAVERVVRRAASDADFRLLREAIATAEPNDEERVIAALVLVDHFAARESFADALAVIDAAILGMADRAVPIELRRTQIRLLLDVGRVTEARAQAVASTEAAPGDAAVWMLRALCAYRDDDLAAASVALAPMTGAGPLRGSSWVEQHRNRILDLAESIRIAERDGGRRSPDTDEVVATLRGTSPDGHDLRVRTLDALLARPETRGRGLRVGLLHSDPILRIRALRALSGGDIDAHEILIAAFDDDNPRVRGAAACAAVGLELDPDQLLRELENERSAYPFRCLHEALRDLVGPGVDLPPGAEESAETRSHVRNAWRRNWNR